MLLAMKKRGFGEGRWNGVGGKVEGDDTIEQAMIRETQEEIGVTPVVYEKVAEVHFDELFKGVPTIMNVHIYTCTKWSGEPSESEEMRPRWYAEADLPYADMWDDDPYWLPQVLAGQKIVADIVMTPEDTVESCTITEVAGF